MSIPDGCARCREKDPRYYAICSKENWFPPLKCEKWSEEISKDLRTKMAERNLETRKRIKERITEFRKRFQERLQNIGHDEKTTSKSAGPAQSKTESMEPRGD